MTYDDQLGQQADSIKDVASRILRDLNRKTRVIVLVPGTATVSVEYPKITISSNDDLLRLAPQLLSTGLVLCFATGAEIVAVEQFAHIVKARIYGLADLPDLDVTPTDQMLTTKYEPLSYHELPTIVQHIQALSNANAANPALTFDGVGTGDPRAKNL